MSGLLWLAAGFGAIVGSFLNVVIYRLPRGEPLGMVRRSRSQCPGCGAMIHWYDNIPLLSYLALRGKCRACGWRIPLRYPLVEAATALLFALCAWRAYTLAWAPTLAGTGLAFALAAGFLAVVFSAAVIDWSHKILPDALTLRAAPVLALIATLAVPAIHGTAVFGYEMAPPFKPGLASLLVGAAGALAGGATVAALRWAGTKALGREAMGLGDVKLMAASGLMLGPGPVLLALLLGVVLGGVFGGVVWAITRDREIPFGPFLGIGVGAVLLYGDAITHALFVAYPAWLSG